MAFLIHANLDCEARWAGITLPAAIQRRLGLLGALVAALAPEDALVEVWAPAAVDPRRLVASSRWTPPAMLVGAPPHADLAWAQAGAKPVNDRRLALAVAQQLGIALPGARVIGAVSEVDAISGRWVCKAPWTAAGRDRCHGEGAPTIEQRARLTRLLDRFGALVLEPWLDRILDVGVCASVGTDRRVTMHPAHALLTDPRGGFLGIDLEPPDLLPAEHARLAIAVDAAGGALADLGYAGPFAIDAFAYRANDERRFHALCEINARYSFGWIARALGHRLGTTRLGFTAPPPGATVLIAPGDDGVTAWCA